MDSESEAILEVSRETFSTFFSLFLLLNNEMYRRDFGRFFKVGEQVSIIFIYYLLLLGRCFDLFVDKHKRAFSLVEKCGVTSSIEWFKTYSLI